MYENMGRSKTRRSAVCIYVGERRKKCLKAALVLTMLSRKSGLSLDIYVYWLGLSSVDLVLTLSIVLPTFWTWAFVKVLFESSFLFLKAYTEWCEMPIGAIRQRSQLVKVRTCIRLLLPSFGLELDLTLISLDWILASSALDSILYLDA